MGLDQDHIQWCFLVLAVRSLGFWYKCVNYFV